MTGRENQLFANDDPQFRRLLWEVLGATRGGENRARIIHDLRKRPKNLNQLATNLNLNYRAIQHHIEVLRKNNLVFPQGERYGLIYFLNQWLEAHYNLFEEICTKLNFKFEDLIEPRGRFNMPVPLSRVARINYPEKVQDSY
ncbi:MAG TPA: winged helix-turn-helix domain-containing protein [Nitrososphaerales archaeon]|nr:winged helix-turn-helix domain-containing protein [Nitrososphaerales archaeon]